MNRKEFIVVLIITFVVIMVWLATDIYLTKPSVLKDPELEKLLEPINPNFDESILKQFKVGSSQFDLSTRSATAETNL